MRVKAKLTFKHAVCEPPERNHYSVYSHDFDFDSREWSCS